MDTRRKPTQAESLGAGIIAGAVEGFITYPAEFVKTKAQFSRSAVGEVSHFKSAESVHKLNRPEAGSSLYCQAYNKDGRCHRFILGMWSVGRWKRS